MLGLEAEAAAAAAPAPALEEAAPEPAPEPVLELSKAEEQEPAEPAAQPAPAAPPPSPAPDSKPARPIAATPLKPSSHAASAAAAPAAAAAASPARPAARGQTLAARKKKSGVERWAMIAGAAVVLLAAGSALYMHLHQDSSDNLVAVLPPQDGAPQDQAQGLDAGEAVVAPAMGAADPGTAETAAAPSDSTTAAADTATASAALPGTAPGNGAAGTGAAPAARHADAVGVVNGTTFKLLIKPWGTVYVNGVDRGVSPPVKRLTLGQGQHTIRIVNPNFAEHVMTVNAGGAESATIEHDFTAQAEGGR